jgi:hypothetical protein
MHKYLVGHSAQSVCLVCLIHPAARGALAGGGGGATHQAARGALAGSGYATTHQVAQWRQVR